MQATMKYVALDKPQVQQYVLEVVEDDKRSQVDMDGEGKVVKVAEIKEQKKDKIDKPDEKEKENDIPEKAARAVKAIKALHPDAVVKEITHEVFDDGSGEIEILTYEVEFFSKGVKHEMVASPESVISYLWAPPSADQERVAQGEMTEAARQGHSERRKWEKAQRFEIRASGCNSALEKPKDLLRGPCGKR